MTTPIVEAADRMVLKYGSLRAATEAADQHKNAFSGDVDRFNYWKQVLAELTRRMKAAQ